MSRARQGIDRAAARLLSTERRAVALGDAHARRACVILALVPALAASAGCGSGAGSKPAVRVPHPTVTTAGAAAVAASYELRMQELGRMLSAFFAAIGQADASATAAQAAANIQTLQRRLRSAARQLATIEPPAAIATVHRQLIAAVGEYANELDSLIARLRAGDEQVLATIPHLKGVKDMGTATQAIRRAGYDIIGSSAAPSG